MPLWQCRNVNDVFSGDGKRPALRPRPPHRPSVLRARPRPGQPGSLIRGAVSPCRKITCWATVVLVALRDVVAHLGKMAGGVTGEPSTPPPSARRRGHVRSRLLGHALRGHQLRATRINHKYGTPRPMAKHGMIFEGVVVVVSFASQWVVRWALRARHHEEPPMRQKSPMRSVPSARPRTRARRAEQRREGCLGPLLRGERRLRRGAARRTPRPPRRRRACE